MMRVSCALQSTRFRGRLAKAAERNYSNIHTDVSRLEELGLIERGEEAAILVPYESVEILVPLAQVA